MAELRETPYGAFNYLVQLSDTSDPQAVVGGFSEVTGLGVDVDVIEYRNGNEPTNHLRKVPGMHHTKNVVLRRGVIGDLGLVEWLKDVLEGKADSKRNVRIEMMDESRESIVMSFQLQNAWPCAWDGPTLAANGRDIAIERIELCYEQLVIE